MENKNIFYNPQKLLSYNGFFNFVIGERGVGKSYGMKLFNAKRFINFGEEFAYVRRYATEVADATMSGKTPIFWKQLANEEIYQKHKFTNSADTFYIDKKVCGYAIPLSTANIKKSVSFDKVKTIVFDEFILDDGGYYNYLNNEVYQFLDLVETVGRMRDIRVIFLGNAISQSNPYFDYFNLHLPYNSEFAVFKDGLIVVNYIKNLAYREEKKKTKFGRLIDGTTYGQYAIDNKFLLDTDYFIKKKNKNCKFSYLIKANKEIYGVWRNDKEDYYLISKDYDSNYKTIYTLDIADHTEATQLLLKTNPAIALLIEKYRMASLFFEDIKTKNNVLSILDSYI